MAHFRKVLLFKFLSEKACMQDKDFIMLDRIFLPFHFVTLVRGPHMCGDRAPRNMMNQNGEFRLQFAVQEGKFGRPRFLVMLKE